MTDRPDDRTQPISTGSTTEQPPVGAASPASADVPVWARAAQDERGSAAAHPVPAASVAPVAAVPPLAAYAPWKPPVAAVPANRSWRSRVSGGRGLAVAALVVGLGVGAVGGAAVTFAATHHDGIGTTADGIPGLDRDGDGGDGLGPHGGPGGLPGDQFPEDRIPGGENPGGQLPGGGSGADANGTAPAT